MTFGTDPLEMYTAALHENQKEGFPSPTRPILSAVARFGRIINLGSCSLPMPPFSCCPRFFEVPSRKALFGRAGVNVWKDADLNVFHLIVDTAPTH